MKRSARLQQTFFVIFLLSAGSMSAFSQVVISQIYGGGGNTGATYRNDFIELFNRGNAAVNLNGYSVQYASATGASWAVTTLTNVNLQPGQYYLVQQAAGAGGTTNLPTADRVGTISMSGSAGKVLLSTSTTALAVACPTGGAVIDLVGYGSGANCSETSPMASLSNTTAGVRTTAGCTDNGNNSTDFTATTVNPRNTATALNPCSGGGGSTNPGITVSASVNPVLPGNATTLTATNTAGTTPTSVSFTNTCNLAAIGGTNPTTLPVSYNVPSNATPGTYSISCTVTDDQSRTGTYSLNLVLSSPPPTARKIYEITGSGTASPLVGTQVTTSGVVTGVRSSTGSSKGFYLESISSDRDADSNTSEGLLVFIGSSTLPACAVVGNLVEIQGTVADFVPSTAPVGSVPLTELTATSNCTVLSTPGTGSLPSAITISGSTFDASGSATQARKYLGMRVGMTNAAVVGPSTGTVTETSATSSVGFNFFVTGSGVSRPFHAQTGILATRRPSDAANTVPSWNGNPELLRIDASALVGGSNVAVATGSTVSFINGIMDYDTSAGQYKVVCGTGDIGTLSPSSPTLAATPIAAPLSSDLLVVDANIERFFNTASNGGDVVLTQTAYDGRLNKLSLAVRNVMRMPDIIALQEVEGPTSGSSFPVLQDIVNKINADASSASQGSPNYGYCGGITNDPGKIAPAVIFRQDRVSQLECSQYGTASIYTLPYTTTPTTNTLNDRPPVVFRGRATAPGSDSSMDVRVVVNHLRSLNGIDEPGTGNGDRVRTKRGEQAKYLANLVSGNLGSEQNVNWSLTENLIVAGDMNAFDVNDGYGDTVSCIAGSPAPASQIYSTQAQLNASSPCAARANLALTNLTTTDPAQRYSYSYAGIAQRIDHVLVNSKLNARVRDFTYVRNNADFPEGPTYRSDFNRPERYSDHDAPAVYLKMPIEVTSRSRVNASAVALNRSTGRYNGTITVTNTGTTTLAGPIYVFFTLSGTVTLPDFPQANGLPYATINIPAGLAPGTTSASVAISFANPTNARISYTTKRYAVNF